MARQFQHLQLSVEALNLFWCAKCLLHIVLMSELLTAHREYGRRCQCDRVLPTATHGEWPVHIDGKYRLTTCVSRNLLCIHSQGSHLGRRNVFQYDNGVPARTPTPFQPRWENASTALSNLFVLPWSSWTCVGLLRPCLLTKSYPAKSTELTTRCAH